MCETLVISFDENPFLMGREYIGELYNAIVNQKVLNIIYHPFKQEEIVFEIHPYHLKQFNNRWFLFGINTGEECITNIALDRIVSIAESKAHYIPNTNIDFDEFFEDAIGVSIPFNEKPEKIILKIEKELWPYIKTKPLHGSQKLKKEEDDFSEIEIEVFLNYELESLILSFGEKMKVVEPVELRDKIKRRIQYLNEKYSNCAD